MISSKTGTVIRFVSALAILVYGAFMLFLGENSILDKLFIYFASFCLTFSELLSTKTYNLCSKEERARIAIHAAASAAILILGIVLLCLGIKLLKETAFGVISRSSYSVWMGQRH